jgi:enoyl-CoA hydratase
MKFTQIDYETRGEVAIIRFNRPEVRNCIGMVTHEELVRAWTKFCERDHPDRRRDKTPQTPGLVRD